MISSNRVPDVEHRCNIPLEANHLTFWVQILSLLFVGRSDILEFGAAFRFGSFTQSHKLPENPPQRFVPAIFSAEKAMAAWLQLIPAQVDQSFEHEASKNCVPCTLKGLKR